jgi:hypothetical protein
MIGEEKAGRARSLRGKTKPAGGKLGQAFCLPKRRDERQALKPLFERPGRVLHRPCLDDEKTCRVETKGNEARSVRASPFARGLFGEAPQQDLPMPDPVSALRDHGKGKTERRWGVAVGGWFDFVQPRLSESV